MNKTHIRTWSPDLGARRDIWTVLPVDSDVGVFFSDVANRIYEDRQSVRNECKYVREENVDRVDYRFCAKFVDDQDGLRRNAVGDAPSLEHGQEVGTDAAR